MVGNVQFHDIATQVVQLRGFGTDNHPFFHRRGTRSRIATAAFNFHQAQATGAKSFQAVGGAEFGDVNAHFGGCPHNGSTNRDLIVIAVDGDINHFGVDPGGGAEITFTFGDSF